MKALLWRDIRLAFGPGNNILTSILFFAAVITITPFAIGPDSQLLAQIGPGMLWTGALFATLLGLDRLFQTERDDGSLDLIIMSHDHHNLTGVICIKCIAHWIGAILPLIIASPLFGLMLNLPLKAIFATSLTLLLGTPAITLIGAVGAALATSLPRGGVLISIIILPLAMPVMIFGVSAAYAASASDVSFLSPLLFLISISLFFAIIGPFAASIALKYLSE